MAKLNLNRLVKSQNPSNNPTYGNINNCNHINHHVPPRRMTKSSLNCYYTNADSLLNKIGELTTLATLTEPDLIMITEALPKNVQTAVQESELKIDGYELYTNLDELSCRRGVCIYAKSNLGASQIQLDVSVKESVWCELKLKGTDKLLIGCIYRSPNASPDDSSMVNEVIKKAAKKKYTHVVIGGDFNHPELDWLNGGRATKNPDHKSSVFLEAIRDSFLYQHVRHPTHYRCEQTPSTIDLLFTNEDSMLSDLHHNAPLGKSHHVSLTFNLNCYIQQRELEREHHQYYKGDFSAMRTHFNSSDLPTKMLHKSAEECWNMVDHQLRELQRLFVPKIRIGKHKTRRPLWMNAQAMAKVKKKWHAFKRYRETREGQDHQQYLRARNQAKWAVRQAKKAYETSITKEVKTNPKVFYKYAKSKLKTRSGIADLEQENGEKTRSTEEKAEVLNTFFASVFTNEALNQIPDIESRCNKVLNNVQITVSEVTKKIKNLKVSKTPGPDGHHPRLLRELLDSTFPQALCILFQKSLSEGWLPQIWRDANVSPIFKKGSKTKATNYRPVSLTCIICKILESLLRDVLMDHMFANNLFSTAQHGFLEARSCVSQLIAVMDKWTEILEDGGNIDTLYLDFRKAFDTVPHIRLFKKLESYGIGGPLLGWIQAFLSNRRQRVMVDGVYSSWKPVTSGIPQGSILGPLLFVVFINDLPDYLTNIVYMFADDTKVFAKVSNDEDRQSLQDDLDKLMEWSSNWQLGFNISKCKVMHLGNDNQHFSYYMGSEPPLYELESTLVEKDLGVHVDNELNFDHHVTECVKQANKTLGLIRRTYQHLDSDTLKTLYVALVRPKLEYGNVVWSPRLQSHIDELERVQRRATKLVSSLKEKSYEDRLRALNLPSLAYRRMRGDAIETYKFTHGKYNVSTLPFELVDEDTQPTRNNGFKISKERCISRVRKDFLGNRVVNPWNSLPSEVVQTPSLNSFKARLDNHWESYQYLTDVKGILHRTNSKSRIDLSSYI